MTNKIEKIRIPEHTEQPIAPGMSENLQLFTDY